MSSGDEAVVGQVQEIIDGFRGNNTGRSVAVAFANRQQDAGAGWITLHQNGQVVRPVASVIKVALVMGLYDLADAGSLVLDEQVSVQSLGDTRYCSIMKAFDPDRALSLAEMAALALITSDNPIAVMLEDRVGYDAVNAVLQRAGIKRDRQMCVGFREGELGPKNRANALSVLDTLNLFALLSAEPRYRPIVVALENNLRNARIPALLPDEAIIAHKTGSLEDVVNDAGIVRLGQRSFRVAFLCDGEADVAEASANIAVCSEKLFNLLLAPK